MAHSNRRSADLCNGAKRNEIGMREAMRGNGSHKVRKHMQGRPQGDEVNPCQMLETPQGAEYPRTPYNHSIRAKCQKLEYVVFWQRSDKNQKKNLKAFFVVWSGAEHYKKQEYLPHTHTPHVFISVKKDKKTVYL